MKKLLIIRSVSFQQLDKNLVAIVEHFKDYKIGLLTHEHGVLLAQKYKDLDEIYVYPYTGGFNRKHKVEELKDKAFDTVIIPVTNLTGAGFFNVLLFSLSLQAKKRVVCNVVSEFREVSQIGIVMIGLKSLLYSLFSSFFTMVAAFFIIVLLPIKLRQIQSKERE